MSRSIVSALTVLMIIGAMSLDQRSAMAAGSVSVTAWSCPEDFVTAIDDVAVFTEACSIEAADLTFALTSGEITRRRVTAAGKPASWPSVSGKLTVTLEKPENENGALFCSLDGADPAQVEVKNASAELDLITGNSLDCQWYRLPSTPASPVASPSIPTVKTAMPSPVVTATSTNTPTQIPSPLASSTRTPTQTATATPTNVPTGTATQMIVPTDTATATVTSSPTLTPTLQPTESPEPTETPSSTPTTEPTATPTAEATATSTPTVLPTIPPSATPQPTRTTPPTATAFPTATEAPTQPPPATATKEPGPKALSTQIAAAIDGREPDYHLDLHQMTYEFGDDLLVYPNPEGPRDGQFAVRNFVLVASFINPPRDDDGVWDYGILFGPTSAGDDYRFTVSSTGEWFLFLGSDIERQGEAEDLLTDYRERNTLRFIVSGDRALLFLNDELLTSVRLQAREKAGQLWLATTNKDSNEIAFLDLDVWALP